MKLISFVIICLLLFSCKNTKQIVKSNTEVKTSTETSITKVDETKTDTKVISAVAENVTETDNTVIEEKVTELSKPDSTGKQYPEKITERVISTGKKKQTETKGNAQVDQKTENKVTESEKKSEDKALNNETDVKIVEKKQSWKVILPIVLGLIIAGFVVYKLKGGWIKKLIFK